MKCFDSLNNNRCNNYRISMYVIDYVVALEHGFSSEYLIRFLVEFLIFRVNEDV